MYNLCRCDILSARIQYVDQITSKHIRKSKTGPRNTLIDDDRKYKRRKSNRKDIWRRMMQSVVDGVGSLGGNMQFIQEEDDDDDDEIYLMVWYQNLTKNMMMMMIRK